jgi:hypothetical protein
VFLEFNCNRGNTESDSKAIALLPQTQGVARSQPSPKQILQPSIEGSGCAMKERPMYSNLLF